MKIKNFENIKYWWNLLLLSQNLEPYKAQLMVIEAYDYTNITSKLLTYAIVLNCRWRIELTFEAIDSDDVSGSRRTALPKQTDECWYVTLKDLEGIFYRNPIEYDILENKTKFVKTVIPILTDRWHATV